MIPIKSTAPTEADFIHPAYRPFTYASIAVTTLAAGALFSSGEATRIIALTILGGISFSIANNWIAGRECIQYYTIDKCYHSYNLEHRLIRSLDPKLNAVAWGINCWMFGVAAGSLFALLARMPVASHALPMTFKQIAPVMGMGAFITFVVSSLFIQLVLAATKNSPHYTVEGIPSTLQASWHACRVRHFVCYATASAASLGLALHLISKRQIKF
jgi:hypothetical protein